MSASGHFELTSVPVGCACLLVGTFEYTSVPVGCACLLVGSFEYTSVPVGCACLLVGTLSRHQYRWAVRVYDANPVHVRVTDQQSRGRCGPPPDSSHRIVVWWETTEKHAVDHRNGEAEIAEEERTYSWLRQSSTHTHTHTDQNWLHMTSVSFHI